LKTGCKPPRTGSLRSVQPQIKALCPGFAWSDLGAAGVSGTDRLNFQYTRSNEDPTERYVQTVRNSSQYRLKSDTSGFKRLYLAGDWTDNALNLGSVEAAAMSGMLASRAISGFPRTVIGVDEVVSGRLNISYRKSFNMLPQYVNHGADLSYPTPLMCAGTTLYGFILEGQSQNLLALCRRVFYEPSGGQVYYYPLSRFFMLTVGYIQQIYSTSFNCGWTPEAQAIVWIPTAAVKPSGSKLIAERLAWFPAYTIVSNPYSLVSGREVIGFFKGFGWIDVPEDGAAINPARLGADVFGIKDFAPQSSAQRYPLFELTRAASMVRPAGNVRRSKPPSTI
jgi:hypothetical protein